MISVIIPTRNRSALLARTLASIVRQSASAADFEVIVVDNGSSDATGDVVRAFASELPILTVVHEVKPGLHNGRHAGWRQAQGDVLVFADDDIVAEPDWIAAYLEAFADPDVAMAGGNNRPDFLTSPPGWLERMWSREDVDGRRKIDALSVLELPHARRMTLDPMLVWGCNFAVRRCVLDSTRGFHPDGMPMELLKYRGDGETHVSAYLAANGLKCLFHPQASVAHAVTAERMTPEYFYRRGFAQGISDSFATLRVGLKTTNAASFRSKIASIARPLRLRLGKALAVDREVSGVEREMAVGHAADYTFHQRSFDGDPQLQAWVLRPDYLER